MCILPNILNTYPIIFNSSDRLKVISVNISQIKSVKWKDKLIKTGIFKEPFKGILEVKGVKIVGG